MRIAIIQGHPDKAGGHFCDALEAAYAEGARESGHEVRVVHVARLAFPLLASKVDWDTGEPVADIRGAQETIAWADHLVVIYPLWLGDMPALLKGFLEQVLRPGFAVSKGAGANAFKTLLSGRSARIVVTMGMPAFIYRWYFGSHSLISLKRNILGFCGIGPIRCTVIGSVEGMGAARRDGCLSDLRDLGRNAR